MATTKPPSPRGPVARKLPAAPMPIPIVQRRPYPIDLAGPVPAPPGPSSAGAILQPTYGGMRLPTRRSGD